MYKFTSFLKIASIVLVFLIVSCQKSNINEPTYQANQFTNDIVTNWVDISLDLVRTTPGYSPPVASRSFGLIGITMYESVVQGMPGYKSLSGQVTNLPTMPKIDQNKLYHWSICANAAAYEILTKLYPTANNDMKKIMQLTYENNLSKYKTGLDPLVIDQSIVLGKSVANTVYNWSTTDNIGNEGYLKNFPASYVTPVGESFWVPTSAQLIPLQPYWGQARSFIPNIVNQITIPKNPTFSTDMNSLFFEKAHDVYTTVNEKNPTYMKIAFYWADDAGTTFTPPGHVVSITSQIIKEQKLDLGRAAEAIARVGMCVGDAFICCWKTKFDNNLLRPVSYIQKYIDPTWKTQLNTPPFPSYTSGHASCSGAGFDMLTYLFGENYTFVDNSHKLKFDQGDKNFEPRTFSSFKSAAEEAALSRLYGGIHYDFDNIAGLESGRAIAKKNFETIITKQ